MIKIKNISYLLAGLLIAGILGLSAVRGFVREDIIITDIDPTDDVNGGQIMLEGPFGWFYTAHGLAAAFGLLFSGFETVTGPMLTNLTRSD